eukprot:sb/3462015/
MSSFDPLRSFATTKKIECPEDIEHFDTLEDDDKKIVEDLIADYLATKMDVKSKTPAKKKQAPGQYVLSPQATSSSKPATPSKSPKKNPSSEPFNVIVGLCDKLRKEASYNVKSEIIQNYISKSPPNPYLTLKLLIPSVDKRVYNLGDKQIVKVLSVVLKTSQDEMIEHLEKGDVGATGRHYYKRSTLRKPDIAIATMDQVDKFLEKLTGMTREDEQVLHFKSFIPLCTPVELQHLLYLIKKDLRINAREKHILIGVHPRAYTAFQHSHNLRDVVDKFIGGGEGGESSATSSSDVGLQLMTPIRPMLAEACKSVAQALGKCPQGMYSEIKYDGERVQLHKKDKEFQFFSRSLKPVLPHKVKDVKEFVPKAFPTGNSLILDCEVLLVDNNTGKPLPFGTLGVHKKEQFKSASVCLFVFDILYLNGESLVGKTVKKRRALLAEIITEIPNRILLSEMKFVRTASELAGMISHVLREGLEGLVLKGVETIYEPGKRHWLKVKKDYLQGGSMADSADLVVLGGYLGTGNKGGMCSVFLMGCYCPASKMWKTVCKVGNGHDDAALEKISNHMLITATKIKGDYSRKPPWLSISRGLMPDFLVPDPKSSPVWEITGAEFSQSSVHTAGGISIRFPREPTDTSKQPIRTRYLGHVTSYQPIRDQYFMIYMLQVLVKTSQEKADSAIQKLMLKEGGGKLSTPKSVGKREAGDDGEGGSSSKRVKTVDSGKKKVAGNTSELLESGKRKADTNQPSDSGKRKAGIPEPSQSEIQKPSTTLQDVFKGELFYVSSKISESAVLERYIIAYGGEVVKDRSVASKVVVPSGEGGCRDESPKIAVAQAMARAMVPIVGYRRYAPATCNRYAK